MDRLVCYKCGRYFDQTTGEPVMEFVVVDQKDRDRRLCKPCTQALNYSEAVPDNEPT